MKGIFVVAAMLLTGCATTSKTEGPTSETVQEEPVNRWTQVPGTGGTYVMEVEGGKVYLYWDPPRPNTMVFVPYYQ